LIAALERDDLVRSAVRRDDCRNHLASLMRKAEAAVENAIERDRGRGDRHRAS